MVQIQITLGIVLCTIHSDMYKGGGLGLGLHIGTHLFVREDAVVLTEAKSSNG